MPTTFLTKQNPENDTPTYFAIDADKIETLDLCDTYDDYGKTIGHTYAGDYHLANATETHAMEDCKKAIAEKFSIEIASINIVDAGDGTFLIEDGDGEVYGFNENEVNAFISSWRAENETISTVQGFDYWDGSNHRTIIVQADEYEAPYKIVDDENVVDELTKAIEEKVEVERTAFMCKMYTGNGYRLKESYIQGSWEQYELTPENEDSN